MKLSNFERHTPNVILQRGKSYYKNQYIETLEGISIGQWEAQVEGTDLYTVKVKLSGDDITYSDCDCPYDWDNVCKHEVAVLYALRENNVNKPQHHTQKKTLKDKIQIILDKLSEQQLKDYIQTGVLNKKSLREHFLIHFNHLLEEVPNPKQYRKIVDNLIYKHTDHGYVDYQAASKLCDELNNLLDQAKYCRITNPEQSLTIAVVVLEAIPNMAEAIDDSNGSTSIVANNAIEIIINYLQQQNDDAVIAKMFQWCMQTYLDSGYSDYGYDVRQLFDYFCTQQSPFQQELLQTLDKKIITSDSYYQSELLTKKPECLSFWGNPAAARNIILDNIENTNFRQIIIDEKLAEGDHHAAIQLIKDGIEIAHKQTHLGTVKDWQKQLLEIAKQQQEPKIIAYWAEKLLFDDFSIAYYRLLKHHTQSEDWLKIYQKLLTTLKDSSYDLALLYKEENNHHALFKMVKDDFKRNCNAYTYNDLSLLKQYLDVLIVDHAEDILKIFVQNINRHVNTTGKHIYLNVADDFSQMQKISGGKERVKTMIAQFRIQYKNRPLMQQILSKF